MRGARRQRGLGCGRRDRGAGGKHGGARGSGEGTRAEEGWEREGRGAPGGAHGGPSEPRSGCRTGSSPSAQAAGWAAAAPELDGPGPIPAGNSLCGPGPEAPPRARGANGRPPRAGPAPRPRPAAPPPRPRPGSRELRACGQSGPGGPGRRARWAPLCPAEPGCSAPGGPRAAAGRVDSAELKAPLDPCLPWSVCTSEFSDCDGSERACYKRSRLPGVYCPRKKRASRGPGAFTEGRALHGVLEPDGKKRSIWPTNTCCRRRGSVMERPPMNQEAVVLFPVGGRTCRRQPINYSLSSWMFLSLSSSPSFLK